MPSLVRMWFMWHSTVRSQMKSSAAISMFVAPSGESPCCGRREGRGTARSAPVRLRYVEDVCTGWSPEHTSEIRVMPSGAVS